METDETLALWTISTKLKSLGYLFQNHNRECAPMDHEADHGVGQILLDLATELTDLKVRFEQNFTQPRKQHGTADSASES